MSYGQYNQNPYQQGPAEESGYGQVSERASEPSFISRRQPTDHNLLTRMP